MDHKKVIINNHDLYSVSIRDKEYICTIENVGMNEYFVYEDSGEGVSIAFLDTIAIVELLATGSITSNNMIIRPIGNL
jgi:hypothetical protein